MTLTEQWRKGELEQGWYYIECFDLPEKWIDIDYYRNDCYEDEGFCKGFFDHNDWRGIDKVLAPVPSYEEWRQLHKFLEEFNALEVAEENKKLKDLLRRCKYPVILAFNRATEDDADEYCKLWDEIDETIGEK